MEVQNFQKKVSRGDKMDAKAAPASPPSSSSSPTHEFSFTISLHQPSSIHDRVLNQSPPPFSNSAIDLSPADNIFFHGHLLPLHLLSQFPVISPQNSSTNSLDIFTLPIRDLLIEEEDETILNEEISSNVTDNNAKLHVKFDDGSTEAQGRVKSKSFSLFSLSKWRKGRQADREKDDQETRHDKKKLKFDVVNQVLKRRFQNQPHSFSGSTSSRKEDQFRVRRRRREFSAPASMRTSPANSGPLTPNGAFSPTSDSTMEELQAAIQAAITHCKNSIAMEEKAKWQN
ncbi:BRI1 kinase inhibitor 1 [Heracleum sosnowskyi]|uniref:BRI1 kinase inhibitor 1 n=1 Tax=Heracleum sosnowskyi TaxID=360622 RepID=A0AAD8J1W0_9APIA|nr:BRI1 kinase inhibitor 1 [Heracleum sosnowskyi]